VNNCCLSTDKNILITNLFITNFLEGDQKFFPTQTSILRGVWTKGVSMGYLGSQNNLIGFFEKILNTTLNFAIPTKKLKISPSKNFWPCPCFISVPVTKNLFIRH